jgi:hypothetical protein
MPKGKLTQALWIPIRQPSLSEDIRRMGISTSERRSGKGLMINIKYLTITRKNIINTRFGI